LSKGLRFANGTIEKKGRLPKMKVTLYSCRESWGSSFRIQELRLGPRPVELTWVEGQDDEAILA